MENQGSKKTSWWMPAMMIFSRFSAWILVPLLAGIFLGKWLDKKYDTEPWFFLALTGVSFAVSIIGLVFSVIKEYQKIEAENKKK